MGRRIDLENALRGGKADNFTCQLFRLILKADMMNREKMRQVWPVEVKMVEVWNRTDPTDHEISKDEYIPLGIIVGPDNYDDEELEGLQWQMPARRKPNWLTEGMDEQKP